MNRKLKTLKDFFVYDLKYGIKNFRLWFKIIWNDRNFDHYYLYAILKHKLTLMEERIRDTYVGSDKEADNIKVCILLLDRLMKDEYHLSAFKNHNKKWGESSFVFKDIEDDENSEYKELDISYPNVITEEDEEQQRKEFKDSLKHEKNLYQQDLDMLFEIMRKHIRCWWT